MLRRWACTRRRRLPSKGLRAAGAAYTGQCPRRIANATGRHRQPAQSLSFGAKACVQLFRLGWVAMAPD